MCLADLSATSFFASAPFTGSERSAWADLLQLWCGVVLDPFSFGKGHQRYGPIFAEGKVNLAVVPAFPLEIRLFNSTRILLPIFIDRLPV